MLRPVFTCPDPLREPGDILVLCEVELTDFTPHPTNTRADCVAAAEKYADQSPMFGIEQEYTFMQNGRPLGWPENGFPAPQARTTAASVARRWSAARSSRRTPRRA